ncbi:MAG: HAD-IA family hydrolase [Undibacterium sp.]|uniref:HAD-IA family hydrolase n=1 Tax=Undibacterium sp. TaxID=1914977 RepID=UPI002726AF86|nr:HAD-IA family hydrolase [Undibacterium sp.]MDO8650642.1 HAD-IA family hydrolase [Undibacterium sp.]
MSTTLKALIFDVDGTLADTESAHRSAFNLAFREVGLTWNWDEALYTTLLEVAGGKERILFYWNMVDPDQVATNKASEVIAQIHRIKTRHYEALVSTGEISLRPGIQRLIREAYAAQLPMAIATTTTSANIDVLLRTTMGVDWRKFFVTVCDASTARNKKPAPDVYLAALEALNLPATDCLAFEDSENGLRAARLAGIATIITPSCYTICQCFSEALQVLPHLGDPDHVLSSDFYDVSRGWVDLATLQRWHQGSLLEAA